MLSCHFLIWSSCHHVVMSSCGLVIMSSCRHVIMSSWCYVVMLSCHHIVVLSCPYTIMSSCCNVFISKCHCHRLLHGLYSCHKRHIHRGEGYDLELKVESNTGCQPGRLPAWQSDRVSVWQPAPPPKTSQGRCLIIIMRTRTFSRLLICPQSHDQIGGHPLVKIFNHLNTHPPP